MIETEDALPGRDQPAFPIPERHEVLDAALQPPFPDGIETAFFTHRHRHSHAGPANRVQG